MKTLLSLLSLIILFSSAHAVTISAVKQYLGARSCISRVIDSGDYAADVAVAAWYASYPLFATNPSAMFLTWNTGGNIQARWKSHWAVKFVYQVQ